MGSDMGGMLWNGRLDVCECGKEGKVERELVEALVALAKRMGEGLTVRRCFVCAECLRRFEGYADSGHDQGTDVDLSVVGQYYRHKMLKHVAYLFPVISITPRVFHLSVRKDWPQQIALIT